MFSSGVINFFFYWAPWYFYLAAIFLVSGISKPEEAFHMKICDFFAHPVEYFLLSVLTIHAFQNFSHPSRKKHVIVTSFLFCLFYAASDEFHQSFVPGRHSDIRDWLYDLLGISIGTVLYLKFQGKQDAAVSA